MPAMPAPQITTSAVVLPIVETITPPHLVGCRPTLNRGVGDMVRHRGPGRRAALCHCDTGGPGTVTPRAGHPVFREPAMALSRPHPCLGGFQCEAVGASWPWV